MSHGDSPDLPVGAELARWRRRKKISGQLLGDRVGMSQAKISRLENGVSQPDPQDVRSIAAALGLPADEVERLVALAGRPSDRFVDWHSTEPGLPERQQFLRQLEISTREIRTFNPAVVIGLLQTSEYARALLTGYRTELDDDHTAASPLAVSEAVAARIQRSQVLYEPGRKFSFLMSEAALGNRVCGPADMIAQIGRLREVSDLPNVDVRIIPQEADLPLPPAHGFEIMGDKVVFVDLFNTSLLSRDRRTVRHYQRVFDTLDSVAISEIGGLLDKYQARYVRMLPVNRQVAER
ncbi:helix-turn-helix domain-containing protein [Paractinoplanes atraurantiacus]|uniref:Transcriptional regulator, contains XRE-family HTH domain n=1 Tax=Paractinoplanes atraurantiacus TaxID=1036182 RepID=A0A285IFW0_9ACTN|nr:helix-turn-helix transcriptional regulator [Actinoplanes atraurantiacus]SNY46855.1 Transcriptional regulator, contains XRE-family HTH domain [Actinoplanes atraurantiacus]